jgi:hypothetical protein
VCTSALFTPNSYQPRNMGVLWQRTYAELAENRRKLPKIAWYRAQNLWDNYGAYRARNVLSTVHSHGYTTAS